MSGKISISPRDIHLNLVHPDSYLPLVVHTPMMDDKEEADKLGMEVDADLILRDVEETKISSSSQWM